MGLKSYQLLLKDSSGRFAPFMFGLLLAVSSFSMVMKSRVEDKLAQQKLEQEARAQLAADDLKQALEVDMLLESSYNSTIDIARARRYLSNSSGQTNAGGTPILDNQTGSTLDGLTRQTTLIGVTDDTLLAAAITADTNATAFMNGYGVPTAVFDAQASRQNQLSLSKQNLDAFSAQILEFAKGNGRMPTTAELSTISSTTGLRTFWGSTFSNTSNIFGVISSFTSPWGGGDTYSNHVTLPYYYTNPTYTWDAAAETTYSLLDGFENYIAAGNGVIAFATATGSPDYTYIFERQGSGWAEVQRIPGSGLSGYGMDIYENLMAISDTILNKIEIYRRQNGSWQLVQTIIDPDGGPTMVFGSEVGITRIGSRLHMYTSDQTAGLAARVHYYISDSIDIPNFVYQSTISPASCSFTNGFAVGAPFWAGNTAAAPGPILVVGCPQNSSNRGIAYVYQGTTLRQTLQPTTTTNGDLFGWSIDMNWPYLAIGAYQDEVSGPENGAVYIYQDLDKSFTRPNFSQMLHLEDTSLITSSEAGCNNEAYFGYTVSFIDDRSLAVNAACTNTLGTGRSSDVIIYTLKSTGWTKERQLSKASVFGSGGFGQSMGGAAGVLAVAKQIDSGSPTLYVYTAPEF